MHRFFVMPEDFGEGTATIRGEDAVHIRRVLRMEKGERIIVCDGRGTDYDAVLEAVGETALAKLEKGRPNAAEPPVNVTLFQGLAKGERMDYVVQKAVEYGVHTIVPVEMKRSVARLKEKDRKVQRWQRIAFEAAKQCGRGRVPEVQEGVALKEALPAMAELDLVVAAYENEKRTSLKAVLRGHPQAVNIGLVVGPEGGLDEAEIKDLLAMGFAAASLGPRIFRTESAGPAALAMILYEREMRP
ncbi:16S rRNA (uracil(1498)-N(3))-methyltransferase [Gehongia tenuis]|uniref:Ribosomal RNA small subunit methyltransferase E n=1 Tax=Gehongia tenuis TaxID=2763655 RepID=A0A926D3Y8_9FIRM|nr:16S rRNA (uracil(1498)-N(3))-methyltransferase [Gehongia tenuis]MBC8530907.1 16S rRNA (uracil(1498)-N(3))-methyltransferase [Gehongia tenuis]